MTFQVKTPKRTTVHDVAKAAGVSHMAVSMALRGRPGVSPKRAQEIRRIAKKLNYHPQAAAQFLRSNQTGQLGILSTVAVTDMAFSEGTLGPLLAQLVDLCGQQNTRYTIEFYQKHNSPTVPHQITSGLVDGSIVIGYVDESLQEQLESLPGFYYVGIDEPAKYCVMTASDRGVIQAVSHLVEMGHRRIAFACGPRQYQTHRLAWEGFQQADERFSLEQHGDAWRQQMPSIYGDSAPQAKIEWARQLLRGHPRPTAVVCHGDSFARAVLHAGAELGLAMPEQLSVISRGHRIPAQQAYPSLTTVEDNSGQMAQEAYEMFSCLVMRQSVDRSLRWVEPRLIEGQSVGPPAISG